MAGGWGKPGRMYDYLGAIYRLGGVPGGCYVRVSSLAKALGVTPPTVSIMIRRLASKGLVEVKGGEGARLTDDGLRELTEHLWRLGVLETLLHRVGLDPDEARRTSLLLSDRLPKDVVEELYKLLGRPNRCPHGKPIPRPDAGLEDEGDFCGLPC